jgi:hypothetical protein
MKMAMLLMIGALTGCATAPKGLAKSICETSPHCQVLPGPFYGPQQQRAIERDFDSHRPPR